MKFPFFYCTNSFAIKSISVIGDFNNWDSSRNSFKRHDDGTWMTEIELSPGNYRYKFLINDSIYFNDPNALIYTHDDKGGTASSIIIGENNKRIINIKPASLNIESYSFLCVDKDLLSCENSEKKYYKDKHSSLTLKIVFSDIIGLCAVNAIWYTPNNEIYEVQESVLEDRVKDEVNGNEALFQIDINDDTPEGDWKLQIFINGTFALEDSFTIELKQPEVLDNAVSYGAPILAVDSELPDFLIDQASQDGYTPSESEIKTNSQTDAEKEEELSGEELLGLFDDIKEINISHNPKTSVPDEVEVPNDSNIINLFDEIRESEVKDENPLDMSNAPATASNEDVESDSSIDELLELKDFINFSQSLDTKPEANEADVIESDEASIDEILKDIKDIKDITDENS